MGESRQALLSWVNDLLQLHIAKLDELGSGAAYCQILDSIFLDVPMAKVKFDARAEYEFQHNFKILQAVFTKHGIGRTFDTQRLIKCRLQDNLEFVQWLHRYWLDNFPDHPYDPVARRAGSAPSAGPGSTAAAAGRAPSRGGRASLTATSTPRPGAANAASGPGTRVRAASGASTASGTGSTRVASRSVSRTAAAGGPARPAAAPAGASAARTAELQAQIDELEQTIGIVATERTLYYSKLLEIEELVQNRLTALYADREDDGDDSALDAETGEVGLVRSIQSILYASAEGFEMPYRPEDEPF